MVSHLFGLYKHGEGIPKGFTGALPGWAAWTFGGLFIGTLPCDRYEAASFNEKNQHVQAARKQESTCDKVLRYTGYIFQSGAGLVGAMSGLRAGLQYGIRHMQKACYEGDSDPIDYSIIAKCVLGEVLAFSCAKIGAIFIARGNRTVSDYLSRPEIAQQIQVDMRQAKEVQKKR